MGKLMKEKTVIFCAGYFFKLYHEWLEEKFEILAITDNDESKWGQIFYGHPCISAEQAYALRPERIIIATKNRNIINDVKLQLKNAVSDIKVTLIEEVIENSIVFTNSKYDTFYRDRLGNEIVLEEGLIFGKINLYFQGRNNKILIKKGVKIEECITARFMGDGNYIEIGANTFIGAAYMICAEEGKITIGADCMLSSEIELRQCASHPIFDKKTGKRLNYSRDIMIGNHVWIGKRAELIPGFSIGQGSIVGYGSVSSGQFGENVTIAGSPAQIIKENIEWTRDYLGYYRLDNIADSRF